MRGVGIDAQQDCDGRKGGQQDRGSELSIPFHESWSRMWVYYDTGMQRQQAVDVECAAGQLGRVHGLHVTGAPHAAPRRLGQVGNGAANDLRAAQAEAERLW